MTSSDRAVIMVMVMRSVLGQLLLKDENLWNEHTVSTSPVGSDVAALLFETNGTRTQSSTSRLRFLENVFGLSGIAAGVGDVCISVPRSKVGSFSSSEDKEESSPIGASEVLVFATENQI